MDVTCEQLAAQAARFDSSEGPINIEHYREALEYLCAIDEQVKAELPGIALNSPKAIELHKQYVRHGLPYEQQGDK